MTSWVSTWEELPEGEWLPNDEHGRHWFLDHEGNHWHSDDDGYRIYVAETTDEPQEGEPSSASEDSEVVTSVEENTAPRRTPRILAGVGVVALLVLASTFFVFSDEDEEPVFEEVIYWSDSGRGFSFQDDHMEMVFPNDESVPDCDEWESEYQNFFFRYADELNDGAPVLLTETCHSKMSSNNHYELTYRGDDVFGLVTGTPGGFLNQYVHVFSNGIVLHYLSDNRCQILISDIEPSSVTNRSLHIYSEVILNEQIRFDIDDPWTNQFLQISEDIYEQAQSIDCFFPQFEYEGLRAMFESNTGEVSDAVNDSLATVTVSQHEYAADYRDFQFLLNTEAGQVECDLIGMESVENSSTGEFEMHESETSEADCIVQLYDFTNELEFWPSFSTGDTLVVKEHGQQICASSCLAELQILHLGEPLYGLVLG
tara:strand:- start:94 stop:1374 length:1281 start_codon:yes stop_codon:yes gene_type:complete